MNLIDITDESLEAEPQLPEQNTELRVSTRKRKAPADKGFEYHSQLAQLRRH